MVCGDIGSIAGATFPGTTVTGNVTIVGGFTPSSTVNVTVAGPGFPATSWIVPGAVTVAVTTLAVSELA